MLSSGEIHQWPRWGHHINEKQDTKDREQRTRNHSPPRSPSPTPLFAVQTPSVSWFSLPGPRSTYWTSHARGVYNEHEDQNNITPGPTEDNAGWGLEKSSHQCAQSTWIWNSACSVVSSSDSQFGSDSAMPLTRAVKNSQGHCLKLNFLGHVSFYLLKLKSVGYLIDGATF